ncbi:chromosome condensation regulator RCC1 [Myxococcus sp. CA051A]|uniref:RCC1 domain-containing protein n=1 Tax=unclassified Myxococcus TaxID=2648731 RepID=UPI00157A94D2|nr:MULTISPECIES: chromosome condensation regulator RCC1 [unclassified Myxococcus]NTX11126.1 chromosome condensation regulator RCC1 [Myxococcus sp. CA056]NTX57558.1 chromosome condensation regulator RCC1 [Myxococcus sp. CA039A]NTX60394.1 chromosome condensation regulator RCC1 [Myxococcus sp. CA051A]
MKSRACVLALVTLWLAACGSDVESTPGVPVSPFMQVMSHASGDTLSEPVVRLTGTVNVPGKLAGLTARVNDGEARAVEYTEKTSTAGVFAVELTLPEGDNEVRLEAVDQSGGTSARVLSLRYAQAPQVQVLSPEEGLAITVRRVRVDAVATDNVAVTALSYTLNDGEEQTLALPTTAEGAVSFEVTPRPGANQVVVRARDAKGNTGEKTVTFRFGGLSTAGGLHSGTLRNGRVYVWGRNNRGQLGLGVDVTANQTQPQAVPGIENAASVAFNQNFSMALDSAGAVWTWGENADGQLGLGQPGTPDVAPRYTATKVPGLTGAVAVAPGFRHALVLMEDGTVRAFGNNADGQLGDGTTTARDYPVTVLGLTDVVKLVAGSMHSVALKRDGTVWTWGRNTYGNLGTGTAGTQGRPTAEVVPGLADVVDLANGRDHILAVHADGTVSSWGLGVSGQLGNGTSGANTQSATPGKVPGATDVSAVFANGNYSFARRADGSLLAWGQNGNGQLGVGDDEDRAVPTESSPEVKPLSAMGMGATHVIAVRGDGSVYAWGWNFNGSLGPDAVIDRWSYTDPVPVTLP